MRDVARAIVSGNTQALLTEMSGSWADSKSHTTN